MLGVYIVLRRMSYIGHGLSHSVFGGAVVGYVLALNFYVAAGLWGFLSALAINATARRRIDLSGSGSISQIQQRTMLRSARFAYQWPRALGYAVDADLAAL